MFKTKQFWCGLSCLGVCVMLIGNSAGTILEKNRNMVNSYLGTQTAVVEVSESDDALYTTYVADYANTDELIAAHRAMGERLSAEGSVLLKNNGALPLEKGSAVTLLGVCAETKMNFGARVGCAVKPGQNVKLGDALIEKGFQVNEQMRETYTKVCKNKVYNNANKLSPSFVGVLPGNEPKLVTAEATVEEIQKADSDYRNGFAAYQDAAIVVLGRCGTEAADYYPGETGIDPQTGARNALALTNDEHWRRKTSTVWLCCSIRRIRWKSVNWRRMTALTLSCGLVSPAITVRWALHPSSAAKRIRWGRCRMCMRRTLFHRPQWRISASILSQMQMNILTR